VGMDKSKKYYMYIYLAPGKIAIFKLPIGNYFPLSKKDAINLPQQTGKRQNRMYYIIVPQIPF